MERFEEDVRARERRAVRVVPVWVLAVALSIPAVLSAQPEPSPEAGRKLFQRSCASCHTVGEGDLVGPDLEGVGERRAREWLIRFITEPDQMLQSDPIAQQLLQEYNNVRMPDLGMSEAQAQDIIAYLESVAQAPSTGDQGTLPPGDPAVGRRLFTGTIPFQNGGPSCLACHGVAGLPALGGGTLGPDLTSALERYGGPRGLAAFLDNPPTPTMRAVWADRPLTPEETAHLVAFLGEAGMARSPRAVWQLALLAVGGTLVLLALMNLVWRRRLRAVREPLVRHRH